MLITVDTTIADTASVGTYQIYFDTAGVVVDWGDGSTSTSTAGAALTKAYATPSTNHTIKITGKNYSLRFGHTAPLVTQSGNRLVAVTNWGSGKFTSTQRMFGSNRNLTLVPSTPPDLSICTSTVDMFRSADNFNQNIGNWNVSSVTDMSGMFNLANQFDNGGSDTIKNWNTSAVTNMTNMFNQAAVFNQPIGNWNTGSVTNMSGMFRNATIFNQNISGWDVGAVTDMDDMFLSTSFFNQNLSSWVTGLTAQPLNFSTGANATWVANKATLFPFLSNGITRITT
jgi:surface protein